MEQPVAGGHHGREVGSPSWAKEVPHRHRLRNGNLLPRSVKPAGCRCLPDRSDPCRVSIHPESREALVSAVGTEGESPARMHLNGGKAIALDAPSLSLETVHEQPVQPQTGKRIPGAAAMEGFAFPSSLLCIGHRPVRECSRPEAPRTSRCRIAACSRIHSTPDIPGAIFFGPRPSRSRLSGADCQRSPRKPPVRRNSICC